jgi:hypothetical protein
MIKQIALAGSAWMAFKLILLAYVDFPSVIKFGVMANLLILIILASIAGLKAPAELGFVTRVKSVLQPVMLYAVVAAGLSGVFYYQIAAEHTNLQRLEAEQAISEQLGTDESFALWQAEDPGMRTYLKREETQERALEQVSTMFSPFTQMSLHLTGLLFAGLLTALFTTILTGWLRS